MSDQKDAAAHEGASGDRRGTRGVTAALEEGAEVHGISRPSASRWRGRRWHGSRGLAARRRRVRPDVVFHLASHVTGSRDSRRSAHAARQPRRSRQPAVAACGRPQRVVLAGPLEEPDEGDPSPTRLRAANLRLARTTDVPRLYGPPVVTCVFMVYGPAQRDEPSSFPTSSRHPRRQPRGCRAAGRSTGSTSTTSSRCSSRPGGPWRDARRRLRRARVATWSSNRSLEPGPVSPVRCAARPDHRACRVADVRRHTRSGGAEMPRRPGSRRRSSGSRPGATRESPRHRSSRLHRLRARAAAARPGHDVVGLDTFYYRGCDFGDATAPSLRSPLDLRDVTPADLEGFDAVVHLAALSNDPLGDLNPDWTYEINRDGTVALAQRRRRRRPAVRLRLVVQHVRRVGATRPSTRTRPRPLTPYAESKVAAEEALAELADDGFAPVAMRNATVYGVSPRLRLDIVLNNLVAWAHTTGAIRLQSDGTPWRPLVHVQDVAARDARLLEAPEDASPARPSTSARRRRTTASATSPRSSTSASRLRGHVRRRGLARPAELPRRLTKFEVRFPRPSRVDGRARRGRARLGVRGRRAHVRRLPGAPVRAPEPAQAAARRRRARRRPALDAHADGPLAALRQRHVRQERPRRCRVQAVNDVRRATMKSPVTVVAATMFVAVLPAPRKFGPPGSP